MTNILVLAQEILRLRHSQMLINERYKAREFRLPIHLALGHEAIAVALASVLGEGDQLLLSHRNLHYNLARNGSLRAIVDEFLLRDTGLAGGMYGSMNLINPADGVDLRIQHSRQQSLSGGWRCPGGKGAGQFCGYLCGDR